MDGGILQSRSSAIQIGHESRAAFSSLVFQNISIEQSHRCLAAPSLPLAPFSMQHEYVCLNPRHSSCVPQH